MSQHIISHYDPAVLEVREALTLATSTGVSPEVIQKLESALELIRLREEFANNASSKISPTLNGIVEETYRHDWEGVYREGKTSIPLFTRMMSGPLEGQLLKSLVSIQKAKRVLEIGMYTGYSALAMAEALPDDGELVSVDREEYLRTLVTDLTKSSPHHKKIRIIIGKALDVLKDLSEQGEKFDVIFLDADESEYPGYFKYAFEGGLLNPGGTVLVDNAFRRGDGYHPSTRENSVSRKFADIVASDASLHKVLVPMRDGILIIRRLSDVEVDK